MKTLPNDHYSYRVIWSEEDKEYVGLCAEFPTLSMPIHPQTPVWGWMGGQDDVKKKVY
jgi:hypothetical protein